MLIPASHYGLASEVRGRANRMAKALVQGLPWNDVVGNERLDTETTPGFVVLDGVSPTLEDKPHFHIYMPLFVGVTALIKAGLRAQEDALLADALSTDWGTLAVIATANFFLLDRDPGRLRPVLDAGLRYWTTYSALGERYTSGSEKGVHLWREGNSLKIILGAMGVPSHILRQSLPPEGPAALVKHATKQI